MEPSLIDKPTQHYLLLLPNPPSNEELAFPVSVLIHYEKKFELGLWKMYILRHHFRTVLLCSKMLC